MSRNRLSTNIQPLVVLRYIGSRLHLHVYCEQNFISIGAITSLSIFYFKDKSFLTPFPIPLGIVGTKYDIYQVRAFSATHETSFHYSVHFFCMKRQLYRVYKKTRPLEIKLLLEFEYIALC